MTSEQLKKYLQSKGFTVSDLAKKIGVSRGNLSEKFQTQSPRVDFIKQLSEITGISYIELMCVGLETETSNLNEPPQQYENENYKDKYLKCLEEKNALLQRFLDQK